MDMYDTWTTTMDSFAFYDNLLAFGVGSEVVNDGSCIAAYIYCR